MARPLYGTRYLREGNRNLAEFIVERLHGLDLFEALDFYNDLANQNLPTEDLALMGCNDRYFLLVSLLHRKDMLANGDKGNAWLYARCREVEANPDGYLDLWARGHYKSTIITFAGTIQDILRDREISTGIFSYSRQTAAKFLEQIKGELERNEDLKTCYPDVLYWKPADESPKWSIGGGIQVKRDGNPKEATVEAWGLVEGQPTGVHFPKLVFDDMIEQRNVTNPEQIAKAVGAWELADNLGIGPGTRMQYVGTRYLVGDPYETMIDRKAVKVRLYPATDNGRETGEPVFWDRKTWDEKRVKQRGTLAPQLLQNPAAGKQALFQIAWFRPYEVRPITLNVYIMADPSRGRTSRSDNTAFAVIGIDYAGNKYLLDGARHRMNLSQRWDMLKHLYYKWRDKPGVQILKAGYERYGQQSDDEYFQEKMRDMKDQDDTFAIEELAWPNEGEHSKNDRVQRLQPDFEMGKFFLPNQVRHPDLGECYWRFVPDNDDAGNPVVVKRGEILPGKIEYTPIRGPTNVARAMMHTGQEYRVPTPITRRDQDGNIYDLTLALMDEMKVFPFGVKKDLVDASSRLYDMEPSNAVAMESVKPFDTHTHDA